LLRICQCQL